MSDLDDLAAAADQSNGGRARRQNLPPTSPPQQQQQTAYYNPVPAPPNPGVPMPAGMERCWMVHDRGHQFGPHTEMELANLVGVGTISTTAMTWREGSPRWIPISSVVPMPAYTPATTQNYPAPGGPPAQQSSNRVPAGIFAILLGGLGIHKFVLGMTTPGIIMLLISVLSCGYGLLVTSVIGFIEGIIYLTKTDAQFHQDYVVNKKQWF
jgi:TM2 domain-containing membrane protein YozV